MRASANSPAALNRLPAALKSEQRAYQTASVRRLDKRVSTFSRSPRFPCLFVCLQHNQAYPTKISFRSIISHFLASPSSTFIIYSFSIYF